MIEIRVVNQVLTGWLHECGGRQDDIIGTGLEPVIRDSRQEPRLIRHHSFNYHWHFRSISSSVESISKSIFKFSIKFHNARREQKQP